MKQTAKPVGQVVIGFYFIPLVVLVLFSLSGKSKMGFLAASVAVSMGATALFLLLQSWQQEWTKKLKQAIVPPPKVVQAAPQIDHEAMQKKIDEAMHEQATKFESLLHKSEAILLEKEAELKKIVSERHEAKEALGQAREMLLERTLHAKIQDELVQKLEKEVQNLQFELKTVLKSALSQPRT